MGSGIREPCFLPRMLRSFRPALCSYRSRFAAELPLGTAVTAVGESGSEIK